MKHYSDKPRKEPSYFTVGNTPKETCILNDNTGYEETQIVPSSSQKRCELYKLDVCNQYYQSPDSTSDDTTSSKLCLSAAKSAASFTNSTYVINTAKYLAVHLTTHCLPNFHLPMSIVKRRLLNNQARTVFKRNLSRIVMSNYVKQLQVHLRSILEVLERGTTQCKITLMMSYTNATVVLHSHLIGM